jgi:hypothetical protein
VISFAGDALVCIFKINPNTMLSPAAASKRALQCAFKLKDHYTETLTAHIALSYGQMTFATLGKAIHLFFFFTRSHLQYLFRWT